MGYAQNEEISEIRSLLVKVEEKLIGLEASRAEGPRLLSVNGLAYGIGDRSREPTTSMALPLIDLTRRSEDVFDYVSRTSEGVFRIHPRKEGIGIGVLGPISGSIPVTLIATVRTNNLLGPTVRYWLNTCHGMPVEEDLKDLRIEESRFITLPPNEMGILSAINCPSGWPQSEGADKLATDTWSIVMATMAEPPDNIDFAWADFSEVVLEVEIEGQRELASIL